MKRKYAWANLFGTLLVVFCGQGIAHRVFGSIGWSYVFGYAIIIGYSLGVILISMSVSDYLPSRLTERLYALEAKIAGLTAAPLPEGQTEFAVTLEEYPADKKIAIIKLIREITGLGIREAKDLIEGAPSTIKKGISKADAEAIIKRFYETGAKVEIR